MVFFNTKHSAFYQVCGTPFLKTANFHTKFHGKTQVLVRARRPRRSLRLPVRRRQKGESVQIRGKVSIERRQAARILLEHGRRVHRRPERGAVGSPGPDQHVCAGD